MEKLFRTLFYGPYGLNLNRGCLPKPICHEAVLIATHLFYSNVFLWAADRVLTMLNALTHADAHTSMNTQPIRKRRENKALSGHSASSFIFCYHLFAITDSEQFFLFFSFFFFFANYAVQIPRGEI